MGHRAGGAGPAPTAVGTVAEPASEARPANGDLWQPASSAALHRVPRGPRDGASSSALPPGNGRPLSKGVVLWTLRYAALTW